FVDFFFFFSSRRRHTRFSRDWSSDVCSSDLFYEWALPQITNRTAEPPTAWQPIETAPKGGKWVLLWWPAVTDAPFVGYCVLGERSEERRVGKGSIARCERRR